ncbi:hypothetical protein GTP41_24965 [Pseudoduganella sp. DS3]|uniref:Uncharacterized protein n=1 Tax=Pseudoduganella guangdongensis TaxID=2692179 RepID=A0A6N9HPF5_9BURK|nr:hypothetical protein [Pseudoduganella guangdongensis]MYN05354.1 hypothetical protein [Pseudoduganella guangdongensis]
MSTINKGRSLEQQTQHGTSSIGTWGAGSTGQRKNTNSPSTPAGNEQSAGRTDDLLSGGVDEGEREHGFQTGPEYRQGEAQQGQGSAVKRSER